MKDKRIEFGEREYFLVFINSSVDGKLINDEPLLQRVLEELPELIGMSSIIEPLITKAINNPGLEGYVAIDTSNITISTYEDPPRIVGCIHSCKPFDEQPVLDLIRDEYQSEEISYRIFNETDLDRLNSAGEPSDH